MTTGHDQDDGWGTYELRLGPWEARFLLFLIFGLPVVLLAVATYAAWVS